MKLHHLKVLQALAQADSLQQAATRLHKTQPALSMSIRQLEQECGFTIVDRSQYRLRLTEAGQRFYQQALQVLQQASQLESLSRHLSQGFEASLRIAVDEVVPLEQFLPSVVSLRLQYPATELTISADYRLQALEKLRQGQADLALTPWYPVFVSLGDFQTIAVGNFDIVLVAAPSLLAHPQISLEALATLPQLIADSTALDYDSGSLTLVKSDQRIRVNNTLAMLHCLRCGLGWGMLPKYQVAEALAQGQLLQLQVAGAPAQISGEIHLVRQRTQLQGPVARQLWQHWSQL
jgi:DNA-binding transcriptional LysR family regulator